MKFKFLIAVVAALAPLSLCQIQLPNGQVVGQLNPLTGFGDLGLNALNAFGSEMSNSNSQSQAHAEAQANSQTNSFQDQSGGMLTNINAQQLQAILGGAPGIPSVPVQGVPVLSGFGVPGAASPIPAYNPYAAQDAISESLGETNLASKIRQGTVQVVPPNLSSQAVLQSVHVPVQGRYSNRLYNTQPLPPTIVTQPGSPTIQISSGPAAVVRAAPVIYRQPPSVVYQNEIINRHPAPLSLNPVYVKVYKPGKKVVAPSSNLPCY